MKILVIGSGAREDAICKSLQIGGFNDVFCAPGNSVMSLFGIKTVDLDEMNFEELSEFAINNEIDFTIVGPEKPLVAGIVDYFESKNLKVLGPGKSSARIEGSKSFTKKIMKNAGVPTAFYEEFTNFDSAYQSLLNLDFPIVIKADGLASGKGVYIVDNLIDGKKILQNLLLDHQFETKKVIIEEYLEGEEFSLMSFVSGNKFYPMPIAQDYKRAFDGDKGPNTGGMGAICPVANIDQETIDSACEKILKPFINEMNNQGVDYIGILYAGLILTKDGVKVIEFNVRFGDPETEVVLPRLKSDLSDVIFHLLNKKDINQIVWQDNGVDLGVFVASQGYPKRPLIEKTIGNADQFKKYQYGINFAGVEIKNENIISNGGRLYCVHSYGLNIKEAKKNIYEFLDKIDTTYVFYRKDIGKNAQKEDLCN